MLEILNQAETLCVFKLKFFSGDGEESVKVVLVIKNNDIVFAIFLDLSYQLLDSFLRHLVKLA